MLVGISSHAAGVLYYMTAMPRYWLSSIQLLAFDRMQQCIRESSTEWPPRSATLSNQKVSDSQLYKGEKIGSFKIVRYTTHRMAAF